MFKSTYVHRCTHIKQHVKWMRANDGLKGILTVKDTDHTCKSPCEWGGALICNPKMYKMSDYSK